MIVIVTGIKMSSFVITPGLKISTSPLVIFATVEAKLGFLGLESKKTTRTFEPNASMISSLSSNGGSPLLFKDVTRNTPNFFITSNAFE